MSIKITCLASGSKANCFIIDNGGHQLLLDLGITYKEILKSNEFDILKIQAVLVGHAHLDHSKGLQTILTSGLPCYMSQTTKDELKQDRHNIKTFRALESFYIGSWRIIPFDLEHDVENHGFICISQIDGDSVCYITDTMYTRYKFPNITHYIIECNYCKETLDENAEYGKLNKTLRNRIVKNHMSLETCKSLLSANDLKYAKTIHLMHLSDRNSDAERMKKEIEGLTGKEVIVC